MARAEPVPLVLLAARGYRDLGMVPIPVKARSKMPAIANWPAFEPTDEALERHLSQEAMNLGLLTGLAGIVDIDLDHAIPRVLAPNFLPPTGRRHGRLGSRHAHYWYRVPTLVRTTKYSDPLDSSMLVELRGDGAMTVVPPSVHPCGELIFWEEEGEFSEVSADLLSARVGQLAAATLLAKHWPAKGSRHHAALALGGMLARARWDRERAAEFVQLVAEAAGDEEFEARGENARTSFDRVAADGRVVGAPTLAGIIDDRVVRRAAEWLGLKWQTPTRLVTNEGGAPATGKPGSAPQPVPKLAGELRILDRLAESLRARGVVGEDRAAKLIYLALTSRLLDRPVSVILKGPSSVGKSFLTNAVLGHLPESAYYALTAMSERALAYSNEPLSRRMLVINEAAGLPSDIGSYLLRSLLSEGKVRYETVDRTGGKLSGRLIERDGPTGVILTTTKLKVHPENETRLLSIPISDSAEQTRAVMEAAAAEEDRDNKDFGDWRQLQEFLAGQDSRVVVPYARSLAGLTPPVAVRLRRDFKMLLQLIQSHALLHQMNRPRDGEGRIVALLDDYKVVRDLVIDLISEGVEKSVPPSVRETVGAVAALVSDTGGVLIGLRELSETLDLDKASVSRRVRRAVGLGYLKNLEEKDGKPVQLQLGDPLPADQEILPTVAMVAAAADRCSVAGDSRGRGDSSEGSGSEDSGG